MTNHGDHASDGEQGVESWSAAESLSELEQVPPSRHVQTETLLEMQLLQRQELEEAGILASAAERARVDLHNPMVKPTVVVHQELQTDGQVVEVTEVEFAVTEVNSAGDTQRAIRHAGVASTYGGVTMPRAGFTSEQADVIVGIADRLREAKAAGVLPDLRNDLSEIA